MRFFSLVLASCILTSTSWCAAPAMAILSPRGGELYVVGQKQTVLLNSKVKAVTLELSRDGGETFELLGVIDNTVKDKALRNVFPFTVAGAASSNCVIRARGAGTRGEIVILSNSFSISTPSTPGGAAIPAGSVTQLQLAADSVAGAQIIDGSVGPADLADGSVTTPKIADGAVTTPKVANQNITAEKIGSAAASSGMLLAADGLGGAAFTALPPASTFSSTSGDNLVSVLNNPATTNQTLNADVLTGTAAIDVVGSLTGNVTGNVSGTSSNVTGIVAVANGGTGSNNGSIVGTGALTIAAGGANQSLLLQSGGTGPVLLRPAQNSVGAIRAQSSTAGNILTIDSADASRRVAILGSASQGVAVLQVQNSQSATTFAVEARAGMTGAGNTIAGLNAGIAMTTATDNTIFGNSAGGNNTTGASNTFIGSGAGGSLGNISQSIALGAGATTTASNQFVAGSSSAPINQVYFGSGVTSNTPAAVSISASGGSGTDSAGASLQISGGRGTGNAAGGGVSIATSAPGTTGASANTLIPRVTVTSAGFTNLYKGSTVATPAGTITPTGNVFDVFGNGVITDISSTGINPGTIITLYFTGAVTVFDAFPLMLNGNFSSTSDSTLTLLFTGAKWLEISRSNN